MRRDALGIGALALLAGGALYLRQSEDSGGDALAADDAPPAQSFSDYLLSLPSTALWEGEALAHELVQAVTPGPWQLPRAGEPYRAMIEAAEARYSLPPMLLGRLLWQESRFRPEIIDGRLSSSAGALGIAQFMPATARDMGVDPLDPAQAIPGAARYLRLLYAQLGDWRRALAAYNWGIGNVKRRGLDAAPEETRNYVAGIAGDVGLA